MILGLQKRQFGVRKNENFKPQKYPIITQKRRFGTNTTL